MSSCIFHDTMSENKLFFNERFAYRIPSIPGDLDVDRMLHPLVFLESTMPKGLPRSGTPQEGTDHGYMVHDYQLPTRAIGRGLRPLQRRGHSPFALMTDSS